MRSVSGCENRSAHASQRIRTERGVKTPQQSFHRGLLLGRQTRRRPVATRPVKQALQSQLVVAVTPSRTASGGPSCPLRPACRDQPSRTNAIATICHVAFASRVRLAASRRSAADSSSRVIAIVMAVSPFHQGRRITPTRALPLHIRVNGPVDWYKLRDDRTVLSRIVGNGRTSRPQHAARRSLTDASGCPADLPAGSPSRRWRGRGRLEVRAQLVAWHASRPLNLQNRVRRRSIPLRNSLGATPGPAASLVTEPAWQIVAMSAANRMRVKHTFRLVYKRFLA
jgi:hypothetical protein